MHPFTQLRISLLILCIACATGPTTFGQETEDPPQEDLVTETELPEHAVWRFGKFGKDSGYDGYYRMTFSPNGKLMVARDSANRFRLFDVPAKRLLFEFESYLDFGNINNFSFSPDSKLFLVASEDARDQVTIWDAQTGELHAKLKTNAKRAFFTSNTEITVLKQRKITYYNLESGAATRVHRWGDSGDQAHTFSQSGEIVLAQRRFEKTAYKTQVGDVNKKTTTILNSPTSRLRSADFSPDGNWLVAKFNRDHEAYLWDLRDPHQKRHKLVAHSDTVQTVCFSPDNRFLATTGWDRDTYIWDVLSGQKIGKLSGHQATINSSAFSPYDFILATGASGAGDNGEGDNSIIFWDFKDLLFPPNAASKDYTFDTLWDALASSEHRTALDAVAYLTKNPKKFQQQISDKLGVAAAGASIEEIHGWIEQLSSRRFAERTEAEDKLKKSRMRAENILKQTLERNDVVLEVKYRIERILNQPVQRPKIPQVEQHRLHRTIFALEQIASPESIQTLQNLADAHDHIDIARDARSAVGRIELRRNNK